MNKFTLIDGNNWLRRKYEEDRDVSGLRASTMSLRSEIANPDRTTIFFWDGFGANDYRKNIFPAYKSKRPKDNNVDNFHLQANIFRKIVENLPILRIRVDGWEADDLIAGFANYYAGNPIHIKSTDKDFEQLDGPSHEGRTITDTLQDEVAAAIAKGKPIIGANPIVTADLVVPFKTMVGDTSDTIPGIAGFGKKRWLLSDHESIKAWFDSDFDPNLIPEMSDKLKGIINDDLDAIRAMRDVCLFRPVDKAILDANMKLGIDNPAAIEQILKENLA